MRKACLIVLSAVATLLALSCGARAQQGDGCPDGSYSVILTPDGGTLTILFDNFVIEAGDPPEVTTAAKTCRLHIPLQLPQNTSIGVYKVDYRGYAALALRQQFEFEIVYGFNDGRDHSFGRQIRGQHEGDFTFSQTTGAGLIRRVGCGEDAALDVEASIRLNTNNQPGRALASLDTLDGAPKGGLVYYFNYGRC